MKEIAPIQPIAEITETAKDQTPIDKIKFVQNLHLHRGHSLFRLNLNSGHIEKVENFMEENIDLTKAITEGMDVSPNRKVLLDEGYLYVSSLNMKNAKKKFVGELLLRRELQRIPAN